MYKVLFVCHGNICRSPMAEYIMKFLTKDRKDFYINSKATSTEEIGNDIYPPIKSVLKKNGIPFMTHYASRIEKKDYDYYDYIIVMDSKNRYNIEKIIGQDPNHKIFKLLEFTGESYDISDPWYTGQFDDCFREIYRGCIGLLKYILNKKE